MFQSKPVKDLSDKEPSKLYLWWIQSPIGDVYYDLVWKLIENPIFQIKRLYQWYVNVFRYDYDFDGHCLFAIIGYKLKRIRDVLNDGHLVQEDNDLKALDLAIKLCTRLKEDKYEEIFFDRHDAKWGEMRGFDHYSGKKSLPFDSSRPNAKTPEEKEREREDFRKAYEGAYAMAKREEKWFYAILHKYLTAWWD